MKSFNLGERKEHIINDLTLCPLPELCEFYASLHRLRVAASAFGRRSRPMADEGGRARPPARFNVASSVFDRQSRPVTNEVSCGSTLFIHLYNILIYKLLSQKSY
jgi:hypothetical protein